MAEENPYQPSNASLLALPEDTDGEEGPAGLWTATATRSLGQTRPWVFLLALLGLLGAGFMFLGGLSLVLAGLVTSSGGDGDGMSGWLGLIYIALTAIYAAPAILLLRYGTAIGAFLRRSTAVALDTAIERQMAFWRLAGIMGLASVGVMFLVFIALIIAGIYGAAA